MAADETNEEWRSNLSNWKSLRKSQSSFQRVQDLDPAEEAPQKPRAKTYKEMMEDRQRRQSSFGQHSFDDDDDDDNMNFGSSKTRARSIDDSKQDAIRSDDRVSQSNSNETGFMNEDIVGQVLRYDKEKSDTFEKEPPLPPSAHPPPTSNNHSQRFNEEEVPNNKQKIKIDTNHDFTSAFNPKKSANFSSHRDKFETSTPSNPPPSAGKSVVDTRGRVTGGANVSDRLKMFNKPTEPTQAMHGQKNSHDQKRTPGMTGKENVVEKNSSNMFFEKIIRINQRPNHEKGFGFTISGGREHDAPVVVDKVVRGGSADICELKAGDEIIAINGADVARHYSESVQNVLAQSVATGTIELKVKRLKNLDEEFDEEVFSDEETKPAAVQRKAHNISDSQSSLWSSPPSSPSILPSFNDTSDFLEDLPPPPLPSVPPPPPNWGTFPGESGAPPPPATRSETTPVVSLGLGTAANVEKRSGHDHANDARDVPDKSREEMLRKKSQFLGLRLEESEELKALKGDQEKKLKPEMTSSISVSDSWNSSIHPPHPHSILNDLLPNNKSSFGNLTENNVSSTTGFTMHGGGGGSARAEWSNSRTLEIDNRPDLAAVEEARRREQQEQQKLKEREEQLRLMEEKIRQGTEQLEREKRRMAQETEHQLSLEREKLRQENERQLQKERERLLREKEEQLRIGEERLHREKEENLRHHHEEQLRREKQRMERDMEEQLRVEREKLTREKDEEIRRERERLQREQELQKDRLQREKEERMRQQSEEHLTREKQRLEREKDEQLRVERERLTREKDDALRRERERLQKEQELQKKELQEQFELEQRQQRLDQMGRQRLASSNAINEPLHRGTSVGYSGSQSDAREPSDSDVAEYSMKYGGKTFARLAAHTRSDSLGAAVGSKQQPPGKGDAFFPRVNLPSESGFGQESQRPVSKRLDKADVNENYSSIRSNFEKTPSSSKEKVLEPAMWKPGSQYNHDANAQFSNDRYPDEKGLSGSGEYPQRPSATPWHGRTVSLGSQVTTERTATVEPQLRGQTSSIDPNFEPQFRGNAPLESQFGPPNVGERTTSLGPPSVGERSTSFGQPSGGKTDQQEALHARNQYMPPVHPDEHNAPPLVGERKASLGPQSREHGARSGPHFAEQRTLYEDQTLIRRQSTTGEPGDQTIITPLANISYLLYGDEQNDRRGGAAPESFRPEDTRPGGYNSYIQQGYNKPSGAAAVPPPVDNSRLSTSTVQRDKGFPSYYPPGSGVPDKQFNESSIQHNASTLPHPKKYDGAPVVKNANPVGGPKPFEAPWKYQTSVGDHWLVEEAERMRIAEHTGQKRSWNLGQDQTHDFQKPRDFPEQQHGPDSAGVWAPVNPYANRPSVTETMPSMRSTRTVPDPVKQTLLNRINVVGGTSLKSPTQLGPLPSYPKDYSQVPPPPSHSRSVSNPVTDSHLYGSAGPSAFPPSSYGSAAPPPSHASSGGGAVDSLFAYHRQTAVAQPPESNLTSLASLSHSQGSLHLDGTPQYSSASQSYKIQGSSYANAPPQSYPSAGNVQAQGGQQYRVYATQEPGYSAGRDSDSFPSYRQLGVGNLLCNNCQRPLNEISGRVLTRDGDLKLQCQNCYQENEVKYSKV